MTHSEVHLAVRHDLRGSPYRGFLVIVESIEVDNGGVLVEWRIVISPADEIEGFALRGRNPYDLLADLRRKLEARRATEPPPPPELAAVGAPPTPRNVG